MFTRGKDLLDLEYLYHRVASAGGGNSWFSQSWVLFSSKCWLSGLFGLRGRAYNFTMHVTQSMTRKQPPLLSMKRPGPFYHVMRAASRSNDSYSRYRTPPFS